jgi:hypothetical protein
MPANNAHKIKGQGFHTNPERINRNGRPKGSVVYVRDLARMAAEELAKPGKTKETVAAEVIHMLIHKKILEKEDMAAMKVLLDLLNHLNNQVAEQGKMVIEWGAKIGQSNQDISA